ncbi:hypothetical protein MTR_1g071090 [Medicago truncatula]|uniref:Uncharacterized protein n=1 Tax=Medicago truncatula TaxID=3880 RepID=G7ICP8_MEDTR|nr:hypothetical protein MTR_1g071090 [Medicago truncatula]
MSLCFLLKLEKKLRGMAGESSALGVGLGIGQAGLQGPMAWPDLFIKKVRLRHFKKPI